MRSLINRLVSREVSAIDEAARRIDTLEAAVLKAAQKFREYEALHAAKIKELCGTCGGKGGFNVLPSGWRPCPICDGVDRIEANAEARVKARANGALAVELEDVLKGIAQDDVGGDHRQHVSARKSSKK